VNRAPVSTPPQRESEREREREREKERKKERERENIGEAISANNCSLGRKDDPSIARYTNSVGTNGTM
jgi:hypothetical protein